jgi:copper homeostasis protein
MDRNTKSERVPLLEVIACTVEDAVEAKRGGADRLEVVRDIEAGGLTPSVDLVREIRNKVDLPVRVMLREAPGYGLTEVIAVEKLCCLAAAFNEMRVDGVVLGFLRGGEIDVQMTQKILACAPDLRATFHHAFEDAGDKLVAIAKLKNLPQVDKILAHGGSSHWGEKAAQLEEYARAASPEIEILAGGGVDPHVAAMLVLDTSIREFHAGKAARENGAVSAARVAMLAEAIRSA